MNIESSAPPKVVKEQRTIKSKRLCKRRIVVVGAPSDEQRAAFVRAMAALIVARRRKLKAEAVDGNRYV